MPGITGIISKLHQERNKENLRLMITCMMHEPFYTSGTYANDKFGLYVGWVCRKGSFSDCMPIFNYRKDIVLFFSGENFLDKDMNDANSLLQLYEEEGEDFLKHLNGWFHGILLDCRKEKIILFNDRYGMRRVYYYEDKDEFLFSSEAKSLLKIRPALRTIDLKSLGEFFSCGCVLENRTLFSNISLLSGAAVWKFENGTCVKKDYYFQPAIWENQPILAKETFYDRFKETFLAILPRYFTLNTPVGMSLTGGLDTRMIMACMNNPPNSLPCYTFGGMYRDSYDVKTARTVAQVCHQPHQVLRLGEEFLSNYSTYTEKSIYISDGYLDARGSYELYLNKLAREIAPVRMTGLFGSELLRSFRPLKAINPCERIFHPDFIKHMRNTVKTLAGSIRGHRLSFVLFKQVPWYEYGRISVEESQLTLRTPYMDNDLVKLVYQAPQQATTANGFSLRFIAEGNPILSRIFTDRGVGSSNRFLSMIIRLHREFLFKAEYYYNQGMPQWLAKFDYVFSPLHIEKIFLGRHKIEHSRIWFRRELAEYVKEVLFDRRTASRPYLKSGFLEKMVSNHIKGVQNYTNEINNILTVELIHRLLIEDRS